MTIQTKRIYEPPAADDGLRILVDRIWPRGVSKDKAHLDLWLKEIAPTNELRQWFGHDPARWDLFRKKYWTELDENPQPVATLRQYADKGKLTLLYSARDEQHNQAVALRDYLHARSSSRPRRAAHPGTEPHPSQRRSGERGRSTGREKSARSRLGRG